VNQYLPVGGVDYPRNLVDLKTWFPDEEKCSGFLEKLRWPNGFVCPHYGNAAGWKGGCGTYDCAQCRKVASVTAGTVFAGTRKPLRMWFRAMWEMTNRHNGSSAVAVRRALGLGSYATAWQHKFVCLHSKHWHLDLLRA